MAGRYELYEIAESAYGPETFAAATCDIPTHYGRRQAVGGEFYPPGGALLWEDATAAGGGRAIVALDGTPRSAATAVAAVNGSWPTDVVGWRAGGSAGNSQA